MEDAEADAKSCLSSINVKKYNSYPVNITFKKICYQVRTCKKVDKTILNDISGQFKAGRLTAILGPSGAGKTSLLNILAGCRTKGVTGSVQYNGIDRRKKDRWKSCFIQQESALLSNLTARETLTVAADLKMPVKFIKRQKDQVISDIADLLNLQKSMDTRVCQLSGGEMKRLSIGIELVTNPPIMFFDEPTSGLDSVSAVQIISHLKSLAVDGGRTIVCVIHQPSSKIFDMFDDMYLISHGNLIYGGSVDNMVSTFRSANFICPQYYNRADFALEVASAELDGDIKLLATKSKMSDSDSGLSAGNDEDGSVDEESRGSISSSHEKKLQMVESDDNNADIRVSMENFADSHEGCRYDYAVSQWKQFFILFIRSSKCNYRNLQTMYLRVAMHILVGISLGLVYYQIGDEGSRVLSNLSFLFFLLLFIFFSNATPTVQTFPEEAAVFQRENINHWYSLPAYYFSKILADIPLMLLCPTVFVTISYFMTNQPPECWRMLMLWLVCVIFTAISQGFGLLTGVLFEPVMALFVLPAANIPMLMFSGFFIRFNELPSYMRGMSYVSYFGYGFEAMAQAMYGYGRPRLHCSEDYCYLMNPEKILHDISPRVSYGFDILVLSGVMLTLYVLLYLALSFKVRKPC